MQNHLTICHKNLILHCHTICNSKSYTLNNLTLIYIDPHKSLESESCNAKREDSVCPSKSAIQLGRVSSHDAALVRRTT